MGLLQPGWDVRLPINPAMVSRLAAIGQVMAVNVARWPPFSPRVPPFARIAFTGVVACGPGVATWAT